MGIIYKLSSPTTEDHAGKSYIGQTIRTFQIRLNSHKCASADLDKTDGCRLLNNAIRKNGWDNFEKEIIWECPDEALDFFEELFIMIYNTLAPNGYNLTSGGMTNRIKSEDTLQKMRDSALARDSKVYRKIEANKDLPKYLINYKTIGFKLAKHPRSGGTRFFNKKDTREENLADALAFIKILDDDPTLMIAPKAHDLPKGIRRNGHGFRVVIGISPSGKEMHANYKNEKLSTEECFELALARLALLKENDK